MSTQSGVPAGADWNVTEAIPRPAVAVALTGTLPVRVEASAPSETATVLKSAAAVSDPVEAEFAVKPAPDAVIPPVKASATSKERSARLTPPPPPACRAGARGRPG